MKAHYAAGWEEIFARNGLGQFEDFWGLPETWFEKPNFRRGGWSGVTRHDLERPGGGRVGVFVKRQENHFTKVWNHPLRGIPTLRREYEQLRRFAEKGIPAPALLYYEARTVGGRVRAVLITEELAGFTPLDAWSRGCAAQGWPGLAERQRIIETLATAVRRMHDHHIRHSALYGKHMMIKWEPPRAGEESGRSQACIIDLEKARRAWTRRRLVLRDLDVLNRHTSGWRVVDRVRFLRAYCQGKPRLEFEYWWRELAREVEYHRATDGAIGIPDRARS